MSQQETMIPKQEDGISTQNLRCPQAQDSGSFLAQSLSELLDLSNKIGYEMFNSLPNCSKSALTETITLISATRTTSTQAVKFAEEMKKVQKGLSEFRENKGTQENNRESQISEEVCLKHLDELILKLLVQGSSKQKSYKSVARKRGNYQVIKGRDRIFFHAILKKIWETKSEEEGKSYLLIASRALGINQKTAKRIIKYGPFRKNGAGRKIQNPQLETKMSFVIKELAKIGRPPSRSEVRVLAGHYKEEMNELEIEQKGQKNYRRATKGWLDKFIRRNPYLSIINHEDVALQDETIEDALKRLGMLKEASWFEKKQTKKIQYKIIEEEATMKNEDEIKEEDNESVQAGSQSVLAALKKIEELRDLYLKGGF